MTIFENEKVIWVAEYISQHLAFRDSADDFFSYMNNFDESDLIIDFSGVESITRSFAHQYMKNKEKTKKRITERNIHSNVMQMFELVKKQKSEQVRINTEPIEVVDVVCGF
ncbi:MAG: hypothetical protein SYNGOMJ08_00274 [Candidatus Syntrophoarchaeum sp. GoM_oil]|nr:MAG: hypothetical protein SYNGOMJ08_00274 [Candidatus Syntrophoarchaeum sp. GoM_oil]